MAVGVKMPPGKVASVLGQLGSSCFLISANGSCTGFCSPGYQHGSEMERWGGERRKLPQLRQPLWGPRGAGTHSDSVSMPGEAREAFAASQARRGLAVEIPCLSSLPWGCIACLGLAACSSPPRGCRDPVPAARHLCKEVQGESSSLPRGCSCHLMA